MTRTLVLAAATLAVASYASCSNNEDQVQRVHSAFDDDFRSLTLLNQLLNEDSHYKQHSRVDDDDESLRKLGKLVRGGDEWYKVQPYQFHNRVDDDNRYFLPNLHPKVKLVSKTIRQQGGLRTRYADDDERQTVQRGGGGGSSYADDDAGDISFYSGGRFNTPIRGNWGGFGGGRWNTIYQDDDEINWGPIPNKKWGAVKKNKWGKIASNSDESFRGGKGNSIHRVDGGFWNDDEVEEESDERLVVQNGHGTNPITGGSQTAFADDDERQTVQRGGSGGSSYADDDAGDISFYSGGRFNTPIRGNWGGFGGGRWNTIYQDDDETEDNDLVHWGYQGSNQDPNFWYDDDENEVSTEEPIFDSDQSGDEDQEDWANFYVV